MALLFLVLYIDMSTICRVSGVLIFVEITWMSFVCVVGRRLCVFVFPFVCQGFVLCFLGVVFLCIWPHMSSPMCCVVGFCLPGM